jgi:hypothetical protein
MSLDHDSHLADNEKYALAELLRSTINRPRYPRSPRLAFLKAILAKLDPPPPRSELPPPLRAYDAPRNRSGSGETAPASWQEMTTVGSDFSVISLLHSSVVANGPTGGSFEGDRWW